VVDRRFENRCEDSRFHGCTGVVAAGRWLTLWLAIDRFIHSEYESCWEGEKIFTRKQEHDVATPIKLQVSVTRPHHGL